MIKSNDFVGAKFRKYVGHSAHVTNVRFSHDMMRVMSVGGGDHAIFQWRYLPDGSRDDGDDVDGGAYLESHSDESDECWRWGSRNLSVALLA